MQQQLLDQIEDIAQLKHERQEFKAKLQGAQKSVRRQAAVHRSTGALESILTEDDINAIYSV